MMMTRSFNMIGDERPLPGIATFQATLLSSDHDTGGFASGAASPVAVGPRHCAQSVAGTSAAPDETDNRKEIEKSARQFLEFIIRLLYKKYGQLPFTS